MAQDPELVEWVAATLYASRRSPGCSSNQLGRYGKRASGVDGRVRYQQANLEQLSKVMTV